METVVKLSFDGRASSRHTDGTYPIVIYVRHQGKPDRVSLGPNFKCLKSQWSKTNRTVNKQYPNSGRMQAKLKAKLQLAEQVLETNEMDLPYKTLKEVCQLIETALEHRDGEAQIVTPKPAAPMTLNEGMAEFKLQFGKQKKWGSVRKVGGAVKAFLKFLEQEDIQIRHISGTKIKDFKAWHLAKSDGSTKDNNSKEGGARTYVKSLKLLLDRLVDWECISPRNNPFDEIHRKKKIKAPASSPHMNVKRPLDTRVIIGLRELFTTGTHNGFSVEQDTPEWDTLCAALYMWEMFGMNFKDLVLQTVGAAKEDIVRYNRSKTGAELATAHSLESRMIVEYYSEGKMDSEYLFNYGFEDTEEGHKRYESVRGGFNLSLKALVRNMGYSDLNVDPTTYTIRHAFVTESHKGGMQQKTLQKALGHKNANTMDWYLDLTDAEYVSNASRAALQHIGVA